ncbi:outer membrane lipoprotein carrier protein LolA [Methanoregula sp.]|uniref:LolA family protein n=1 Tax=Methanoregula sp. TaxID=2052170 RepID=UPI0035638880
MRVGLVLAFAIMLLIGISSIIPGCMNSQETSFTPVDLASTFFNHANLITDYQSEYTSTSDGTVQFDWKAPALYRMEYINSTNPVTGSLLIMNRTTAVEYSPGEKTYHIEPDMQYLPQHDYQKMVRQIVQDGQYSVIGREVMNGHTIYLIEGLPDNWQSKDMPYLISKVRAWIDPESGLAWNITTFYPADTVNNQIDYSRIDVNTGIADDHFAFVPPQGSSVQCGYTGGSTDAENYNPKNLPPALEPGCLNCTDALLTRPVGGFSGDKLLVSLYDYEAGGRTIDPDPHRSINYTFYARAMKPGNVRYTVSRVAGLYDTEPEPMPENISVFVEPGEFTAEPGHEYTSAVTVHVKPGTVMRENFWIHIHAAVEGEPDALTDDWVRLAVDDGSEMSGMGLYHFYQGSGGYCQKVLVIRQGETGHTRFAIRNSELDTGNVTLGLVTSPCSVDHGPLRPDERPAWPEGIRATITPDLFTGRSFATYLTDMSFDISLEVLPGDYCFSAVLRTPTGGGDYAPFTVRVIPGES